MTEQVAAFFAGMSVAFILVALRYASQLWWGDRKERKRVAAEGNWWERPVQGRTITDAPMLVEDSDWIYVGDGKMPNLRFPEEGLPASSRSEMCDAIRKSEQRETQR